MKTSRKVRKSLLVASTGVFAGALAVSAAVQVIQPPPSDFIDTEASTNLVFAPLQEDTRHYRLKFSGDFSPSNDREVAFGGDANGDGDLSPEETEARFGVDCGEKKVKVEGVGGPEVKVRGEGEQWNLRFKRNGKWHDDRRQILHFGIQQLVERNGVGDVELADLRPPQRSERRTHVLRERTDDDTHRRLQLELHLPHLPHLFHLFHPFHLLQLRTFGLLQINLQQLHLYLYLLQLFL